MQTDNVNHYGAPVALLRSRSEPPPTVSVIIPTYNRASLLGEAIASVLAQTFSDFEVIIVDDGSTDNTERIICEFIDSRILYVKQDNNGRSYARNVALARARGRYIAFLDSDDLYLPEKLALQVSYLDSHPHVGMLYTSAYCIDSSGNALNENYVASVSGRIYRSIAFFRPVTITLPTVMAKRELFEEVGGFDEKMHRFEDTDMWRRISKIAHIEAMPINTCKLRTHADNSLGSQNPALIISALDYYAKKVMQEDATMGRWVLRCGLGGLYYYYARAFLTIPAWKDSGVSLLRESFRYWPPYLAKYLLTSLNAFIFSRLRSVFYQALNALYRFYRKLRAIVWGVVK